MQCKRRAKGRVLTERMNTEAIILRMNRAPFTVYRRGFMRPFALRRRAIVHQNVPEFNLLCSSFTIWLGLLITPSASVPR